MCILLGTWTTCWEDYGVNCREQNKMVHIWYGILLFKLFLPFIFDGQHSRQYNRVKFVLTFENLSKLITKSRELKGSTVSVNVMWPVCKTAEIWVRVAVCVRHPFVCIHMWMNLLGITLDTTNYYTRHPLRADDQRWTRVYILHIHMSMGWFRAMVIHVHSCTKIRTLVHLFFVTKYCFVFVFLSKAFNNFSYKIFTLYYSPLFYIHVLAFYTFLRISSNDRGRWQVLLPRGYLYKWLAVLRSSDTDMQRMWSFP